MGNCIWYCIIGIRSKTFQTENSIGERMGELFEWIIRCVSHSADETANEHNPTEIIGKLTHSFPILLKATI